MIHHDLNKLSLSLLSLVRPQSRRSWIQLNFGFKNFFFALPQHHIHILAYALLATEPAIIKKY